MCLQEVLGQISGRQHASSGQSTRFRISKPLFKHGYYLLSVSIQIFTLWMSMYATQVSAKLDVESLGTKVAMLTSTPKRTMVIKCEFSSSSYLRD